ncbi:MAG: hypothetical protein HYS18_04570 [Burkholderiales bacterium]|nr:hypothetical protein [Burkholderiales bacterium]
MFAVKMLKMLAAHRNQKWFELKMRDPHTGFGLDTIDDPSTQNTEQSLPDLTSEDTLPPGF